MRCTANLDDRPNSASVHCLSFMGAIVVPRGETKSNPAGEFLFYSVRSQIRKMLTIEETRRARLRILVERYNGMANLCQSLGYARNETATLARILNANVRHERGGKPYNMGSPMAREMELKLSLDTGWMDNPPGYSEMHPDDRITHVMKLMESMPEWQRDQAMRIIDTLAEPTTAKNGTTD